MMQLKLKCAAIGLLALAISISTARADLGFWSAKLVGQWHHPRSEANYQFRSDATYVLRGIGRTERGWWKIAPPTERESGGSIEGPVALVLKPRGAKVRRIIVDTVRSGEGEIDRSRYWIGGAKWVRVGG